MKTDRPALLEKLISARLTGDLTVTAAGHGPADVLIAAGAAAASMPAAADIISLHIDGSLAAQVEARRAVIAIAKRLNTKNGWAMRHRELLQAVQQALSFHVKPACDRCHGVKYEPIEGNPRYLSTRPCRRCRGTGQRPHPAQWERQIAAILAEVQKLERDFIGAVRARLMGPAR
jgi:hypothetical protein